MSVYNSINKMNEDDILDHPLFIDNDYNIIGFDEFFALCSRFIEIDSRFDPEIMFYPHIKMLFEFFDENEVKFQTDFNESLMYANMRIIEYTLDFLANEEKDEILANMIKYFMYNMSEDDRFYEIRNMIDNFIQVKLNDKSEAIFEMLSENDYENIFDDVRERMSEKIN